MKVRYVRSENEGDMTVIVGKEKFYYKAIYYPENEKEYEALKKMAEKDPKIRKAFEEGRVKWEKS